MTRDKFLFVFIVATLICVLIHISNTYKVNANKIIEPDSLPSVKTPKNPIKPTQQPKTLSKW